MLKYKMVLLKGVVERFESSGNRRVVSTALRKNKANKSSKFIVAYDPVTKQLIKGTSGQLAKKLKVSEGTFNSAFRKGKSEYRDIKGFQLFRFMDSDSQDSFISKLDKTDKKTKRKIIMKGGGQGNVNLDGNVYLDMLNVGYGIKSDGVYQNNFWGTSEHRYKLDFNIDSLSLYQLEQIFNGAVQDTIKKEKLGPNDKIRFVIQDPDLIVSGGNVISIPLTSVKDFSTNGVVDMINKIYEADYIPTWNIGADTTITITSIKLPDIDNTDMLGAYDKSKHFLNPFQKRSIVQIKNKDNMCVPRAIITGISRVEEFESNAYDNIKRGRNLQGIKAKLLCKKVGHNHEDKWDISDKELIAKAEQATGYQITIIDGDDYNEVYYPDISSQQYKPPEEDHKTIYLYKHLGHCDLIVNTKLAGFYAKDYYCHKCKSTYKQRDSHKCTFKCNMCCKANCPSQLIPKSKKKFNIECLDCNRYFPCSPCFDNHLKPDTKGMSVCDRIWKCQTCKKIMNRVQFPPESHTCGDYLCTNCGQVVGKEHKCYMFPKPLKKPSEQYIFFDFESDISGEFHEVMFAISQYFHSPESIQHNNLTEWCDWAFTKEHKGYTFIAHNGKGYDYKFIIQWIYENTPYQPFVIFAGQKIMYMSITELKIRFIDSLSFITKPLKAFPKIFGETELKKGYFPHWFNTPENRNYVGPIPALEFFKPNQLKERDRESMIEWWESKVEENYVWDEEKEMRGYCISDVDILRKCCIKFRQLYLDIAEIDPFQYLTIASVCMNIFKYNYIDTSYPKRYKRFQEDYIDINPSQLKDDDLDNYNNTKKNFDKMTLLKVFKEKKVAVIPFKEVEWIRKSFFGGRTNATKLIYNFKEGEEGKYSDITSLYPTVNYYDEYPMGHYEIITNIGTQEMDRFKNREYFGFIDCDITCPNNLYHPVLPRKGNKLYFDLMDKRGVWCSNEIYKALDLGYKVKKIYEIRHYENTTKGLFKAYVSRFLKIKQEASGYPKWVKNPEDEDKYIQDYHSQQGILMDKDKIVKNPGLREIAKLCLNSLWGKFGQRTNMGKCEILKNKEEFYKIAHNPQYENINWTEINNQKIQVSYNIKEKYVENDFNTNIAIASFTTSTARLRLYEALEYLGKQILYFDTDSCVYKYNPDDPSCNKKLDNGDLLGDWTDELEGEKMIKTFVSGGPKNYSYETDDGMYHTKVKGFNLNYEATQSINHESIIGLVNNVLENNQLEDEEKQEEMKIAVGYDMIKRGIGHTLSNEHMVKNYGMVYDKRSILPRDKYGNYDTLPFGYKNVCSPKL